MGRALCVSEKATEQRVEEEKDWGSTGLAKISEAAHRWNRAASVRPEPERLFRSALGLASSVPEAKRLCPSHHGLKYAGAGQTHGPKCGAGRRAGGQVR